MIMANVFVNNYSLFTSIIEFCFVESEFQKVKCNFMHFAMIILNTIRVAKPTQRFVSSIKMS